MHGHGFYKRVYILTQKMWKSLIKQAQVQTNKIRQTKLTSFNDSDSANFTQHYFSVTRLGGCWKFLQK